MTAASDCLVIFGATGDLAMRMLLPALYNLEADGRLADDFRLVGVARKELTSEGYRASVEPHLRKSRPDFDLAAWRRLAARIVYVEADATTADGVARLGTQLAGVAAPSFYFAVSPSLYGAISASMAQGGLVGSNAQVVMEKPIGRDLVSSRTINDAVAAVFSEQRTFRIDHYLGKETVQNLLALRFANVLFEPLWSGQTIDHVQITIAETEGVGDRWPYYDEYGAVRDMVQNHMLQLLCLVAMEPPSELAAEAVRDEKLKVLRSLRVIGPAQVDDAVVTGQYIGGTLQDRPVAGYEAERGSASTADTFVAIEAHIDNWRWAGVPFYLRTGKRLAARQTQVIVQFKAVPHSIFSQGSRAAPQPNRLTIDLQPREDVQLLLMNRSSSLNGVSDGLRPLPLSLSLSETAVGRRRIAYERLFLDVLRGDQTLFVSRSEVEAAWAWIDGIAASIARQGRVPRPYAPGSWGPDAAARMLKQGGRDWHA